MNAAILPGNPDAAAITDRISDIVLERPVHRPWLLAFVLSLLLTTLLGVGIGVLLVKGVGIWGINRPVDWAFAIADYVWWIGIGMAGTFISGGLYIARQPWRASINRYAEAMTVFAVSVSGIFPILHLGRPWFFYWLVPYPNRMGLWPQWRSSLEWDFFAILAYLLVSVLYFYIGLIPDLASLRDRARTRGKQVFYGLLAIGWRGEARHWQRFETFSTILAGLAVPLVFSVHSMVALDFSEGIVPGWHSTIFPPFFVAGALLSGLAMALVIGIPLRRFYGLHDFITDRHLANLAKLLLAVGLVVDYSYGSDVFMAFYSGDRYEISNAMQRFTGAYAWIYWSTIFCNVVVVQALWFPRVRASAAALFTIGLLVIVGMWLERFMLIVSSLYQSYLPSTWGMFYPTLWDLGFLLGSIGLFILLFLLFVRLLPALSMYELKRLASRLREART